MPLPTKAVILAAGRASRMGSSSNAVPKSLMPLGSLSKKNPIPVSFIERQVALLEFFGVREIIVVVNYLKDMFYKTLNDRVTFISNEAVDITQSGSLHSFQFAIDSKHGALDGKSHTLLMDADIVYEGALLKKILSSFADDNIIFVSKIIHHDQEEVRVYGESGKPKFIGKGFTDKLVGGAPCIGEATGICYFHPKKHALIKSIINRLIGDPTAWPDSMHNRGFSAAKKMTEHEDLAQWLMMLDEMTAVGISKEILFAEVDFESEYMDAINHLYPKILDADEKNDIHPAF